MTWFDLILIVAFAALTALGVQRKLMGLILGLGAIILFRPLLLLTQVNPYLALIITLALGLALGMLSRVLMARRIGTSLLFQVLGGVGGALVGGLFVLALMTSLPIGQDVNGLLTYPANLPSSMSEPVKQSRFIKTGRDILFYPLLASNVNAANLTPAHKTLHNFLIVSKPWERTNTN